MQTRWKIAILVTAAIAISYLDRQAFPVLSETFKKQIFISDTLFAVLNIAFLATYGVTYLVGGRLMDWLGTRRGFFLIMVVWSIACASHGLATGWVMLFASRLLLGAGEGGGFPAATRAVAEWFPVKERSTAMGMINGGTALGGIAAPILIAFIVGHLAGFGENAWRWVFVIFGAVGLLWTLWWLRDYYGVDRHPRVSEAEREYIAAGAPARAPGDDNAPPIAWTALLAHREVWCVVAAKFLSDAAWYFYLFWLPKYYQQVFGFKLDQLGNVAWMPHAAAGIGCLLGGGLSSWLIGRGKSVTFSRRAALGASAIVMPLLIAIPHIQSWQIVTGLFCIGYFGQQSWSTLIMILPTDLLPKRAVGTMAGMVGMGGAMGGISLQLLAGVLRDKGFGWGPIFAVAGSLHVAAFALIVLGIPSLRPLAIAAPRFPVEEEKVSA